MRATHLFYDDKNVIISKLRARHHVNSGVQAFDGSLVLLPAENSGEDACYDGLRLFDYRLGNLLRFISFCGDQDHSEASALGNVKGEGPPFIEVEWGRGLVIGLEQSFFVLETDFYSRGYGSFLYVCTPLQD